MLNSPSLTWLFVTFFTTNIYAGADVTWLGQEKISNVWMWVDRISQEAVDTTNFLSGEATYDRAVTNNLKTDSKWVGVSREATRRALCEKEHTITTTTATSQTSTIPHEETTTTTTALITALSQAAVANGTTDTSSMTSEKKSNGESTTIDGTSTTNVTYTELSTFSTNLTLSEGEKDSPGTTPSFGFVMAIGVVVGTVLVLLVKGVKFMTARAKTMPIVATPDNINPQNVENGLQPNHESHVGENGKECSNQNNRQGDEDQRSVFPLSLSLDTGNMKVIAMGIYTNYETVAFTVEDKWNIKRHTAKLKMGKPKRNKPRVAANLHFVVY